MPQDDSNRTIWQEPQKEQTSAEPKADREPSQEGPVALSGVIEKVIFQSEDSQFTVASLKTESGQTLTITGCLGACSPGEEVEVVGEWSLHKKHGRRLQVREFSTKVPRTVTGLKRFLSSGLIPGIGEKRAEQIVNRFGEQTVDVLENQPERLKEISGLGEKTWKAAAEAFRQYRGLRDLLIFVQGHGVSMTRGMQIFNEYGAGAMSILARNPYKLADDITGIGFKTADSIAGKLGMSKDAPERVAAGLLYVLRQACDKGHTYLPKDVLLDATSEMLSVDRQKTEEGCRTLVEAKELAVDPLRDQAIFLPKLLTRETSLADDLVRLLVSAPSFDPVAALEECERAAEQDGFTLTIEQTAAVQKALSGKVTVITGGPGTGKTALVGRLARTCKTLRLRLALCAPTGRAAKRLSEATSFAAKTIHRTLEYNAFKKRFKFNRRRKLEVDLVVMDEASMVDVRLMGMLVEALPDTCSLVIVGDVDQLPSVGPGSVLKDVIQSGQVPTERLTHIFRQETAGGEANMIVVNAHLINQGKPPAFPRRGEELTQFYFVDRTTPEAVMKTIIPLVRDRIPKRFGFDPFTDVQVITPMHRGPAGTTSLNEVLQRALNGRGKLFQFGGRTFRLGDKVMQTRNNYDKDVFNGDIGVIASIDGENKKLVIDFGDKKAGYSPIEMSELVLAYAISVHKSQGSEYQAVVLPLVTQHYLLLQRNLIYTAVTRAKKLVVMVGARKALYIAVRNDKTSERYTLLKERLIELRSGQNLLFES